MRIANKERYALKLMADLALQDKDEYISIKSISSRQGISVASLRTVARALLAAGLIETDADHLYHYRLCHHPEEIAIPDILRATDGKFACTACSEVEPEKCTRYRVCANVLFWEGMQESDFLDSKISQTLQELAEFQQVSER